MQGFSPNLVIGDPKAEPSYSTSSLNFRRLTFFQLAQFAQLFYSRNTSNSIFFLSFNFRKKSDFPSADTGVVIQEFLLICQKYHLYQLNCNIFLITSSMVKGAKGKRAVKKVEKKSNPLFQSRPRNFRVGNNIQPKRNLTRFVRWPKYITFQRQKRILLTRIKVPPLIAQFQKALDKNQTNVLFRLLKKYSPEDTKERKARLVQQAKDKAEKKTVQKTRPYHLKFGLNHVTKLIEEKKAKLVVIASNVDPIELVVWLPTLCRKMDIPYCFVKGKARLGQLVHQKNAAVVALTEVRKEDEGDLSNLTTAFRTNFNDNQKLRKEIGGFKRGAKSQNKFDRVQAQKEKETIKKNQ